MIDVVVGGMLAITGGLAAVIATGVTQSRRARREAQLEASVQLLTSLQALIRRMIDIAYLEDKRNGPAADALIARYHDATIEWNAAMYHALLLSPPDLADRIPPLDREVDRLVDLAMERRWTRHAFRNERLVVGTMAAEYLQAVRHRSGLPSIALTSVWAWHDDPAVSPEAPTAARDAGVSGESPIGD